MSAEDFRAEVGNYLFPVFEGETPEFHRIAALRQAGGVTRFHANSQVPSQTDAQHSWNVAMLVHVFWPWDAQLFKAAIFHDAGELAGGDVPATSKWKYPSIGVLHDELEFDTLNYLGVYIPLDDEQKFHLELVDCLDISWYCIEEHLKGNRFALAVFIKLQNKMGRLFNNPNFTVPADFKAIWAHLHTLAQC